MEKENRKWFDTKHVGSQSQLTTYSPIKEEDLYEDQPELKQKILEHNAKRRCVFFEFNIGKRKLKFNI